MSENYIVINGKKADLTLEQLKALGVETEKQSAFNPPNIGDEYFFISTFGEVLNAHEGGANSDARLQIANYCTDKGLLQQQAYRETLNRLLWRFSMEHDGDKIDWTNGDTNKYHICYNHYGKTWAIDCNLSQQRFTGVYFATYEIAEQAIEEVVEPFMASHPDFKL